MLVEAQPVKTIGQKVDSVMSLMTLDEKIGQLNQYNDDATANDPVIVTFTNTGKYDGEEVVQLYLRDKDDSIARPT